MSDQRGVERPFDGRRDEADGMVLHEERLTPGVERYEVGRVEVRKRIIVEELTVTLPVRREVADLVRVYDDGSEPPVFVLSNDLAQPVLPVECFVHLRGPASAPDDLFPPS